MVNDVMLNVERCGQGAPLVLLHGFTGSVSTWRSHAAVWDRQFETIAIDLLGHGDSDKPADPEQYSIEHFAEDLVVLLDQLALPQVNLLGYSMGGRAALYFAVTCPERLNTLIVESASPGLATEAERQARIVSDHRLADSIERDGIEAFVDYWSSIPLFTSQIRLPDAIRQDLRAHRLQNDPAGLANSLRGLGTGQQPSLWERLAELRMPMLLVAGALDQKFAGIAGQMAGLLKVCQIVIVPDAGHAVHLEQSEVFDRLIVEFLEKWN